MLRKCVIEREVPGIGSSSPEGFCAIAEKSNGALDRLRTRIPWVQSHLAADRTFCVHLAEIGELIREHPRLSGYPASRITEVVTVIDSSTPGHDTLGEVA